MQEIKEGKIDVSRVERANSIKQKYKKKDLKKSLKKNEPLFNETEKKDHTIIHNRNASAEANENKNKKIIKSPVKKKEPKEPKETKEKNAMSAQKRKKEVFQKEEFDKLAKIDYHRKKADENMTRRLIKTTLGKWKDEYKAQTI